MYFKMNIKIYIYLPLSYVLFIYFFASLKLNLDLCASLKDLSGIKQIIVTPN